MAWRVVSRMPASDRGLPFGWPAIASLTLVRGCRWLTSGDGSNSNADTAANVSHFASVVLGVVTNVVATMKCSRRPLMPRRDIYCLADSLPALSVAVRGAIRQNTRFNPTTQITSVPGSSNGYALNVIPAPTSPPRRREEKYPPNPPEDCHRMGIEARRARSSSRTFWRAGSRAMKATRNSAGWG